MNGIICRSLLILTMLAIEPFVLFAEAQATDPSEFADSDTSPLALRLLKPLSRNEVAALKPRDRFKECKQCPEMVVVPDGTFVMGASASESGSTPDEWPQHEVSIQRFSVGERPVTMNEWMGCVLARGCSYRP